MRRARLCAGPASFNLASGGPLMRVSGSQGYQTAILSGKKEACQANVFICRGFEFCKDIVTSIP